MDNYQKVEQLVNKAGCSYEDAKEALEKCGWDMLDAVISLEREGKVKKETAEQKEEPAEAIPEVTAEVITVKSSQQNSERTDGGAGSKSGSTGKTDRAEGGSTAKRGLWKRIKSMLMNNRMVMLTSSGNQIFDVPILVPVIALIAFFWATLGLAAVAMIFGFRFHFAGEDLGKTNINNTMDKATDYAEKVKDNLTGRNNGE